MDQRKMDAWIKKTYGCAWLDVIYIAAGLVLCMACIFFLLWKILGNPFTYEVDALFLTVTYEGWLDESPGWIVFMVAVSAFIMLIVQVLTIIRRAKKLLRPYLRDCDEELCLALLRRGIDYGRGHLLRRSTMYQIENDYVDLLCISRRLDEAREYLKNGWTQGERSTYRSALQYIDYIEALESRDKERFEEIASHVKSLEKYKYALDINRLILNEEYGPAIELLKKTPARHEAMRVQKEAAIARCCAAMGDEAQAAERFRYAAEHGNNMWCARKAREWLDAHSGEEK